MKRKKTGLSRRHTQQAPCQPPRAKPQDTGTHQKSCHVGGAPSAAAGQPPLLSTGPLPPRCSGTGTALAGGGLAWGYSEM